MPADINTKDKCLLFYLPSGAGGMAAGMTRGAINKKLTELRDKGQIGPFKTKTLMYQYKVWLEKESDYTVFFLAWSPDNSWQQPKLTYENYISDADKKKISLEGQSGST